MHDDHEDLSHVRAGIDRLDDHEDLSHVRAGIDRLDEQIIALIGERQKWVERAGRLKKDDDGVRAPERVEHVIAKARRLAERSGASPDVVERTYRSMIAAFIDLELHVHNDTRK